VLSAVALCSGKWLTAPPESLGPVSFSVAVPLRTGSVAAQTADFSVIGQLPAEPAIIGTN